MSAATIIFTDIVGFSKKPTAEQRKLVESLTSEVLEELRTLLDLPQEATCLVALPTGDGLAMAFLHRSDHHSWDFATVLRVILKMQQWAHNQSSPGNSVNLRIGVHVGAVELFTDINGKTNVCGDTINYAQRVMEAANPRQTLFSEVAFRTYVGTESPVLTTAPFSVDLRARFQGPIEVFAKHEIHIPVYKLVLEPSQPYWSGNDPIAKDFMLVTLTPLPKEVVGTFSEQIEKASHIAFIQLTGDRVLKNLKSGDIRLSKELNRFWVFMPDAEVYASFHPTKPHATPEFVKECIQEWKDYFSNLKRNFPKVDFKLGLFKQPPYLGASFINWGIPGGKIHVSPYVWNIAAPDCPGYDIRWMGNTPSPVYKIYIEGLNYLDKNTENELNR